MNSPAPAIGEELPATDLAGFTQLQVSRYAVASGDRNPIHTDLAAARLAGLTDCVVQGMLVVGQFEEAIRRWRNDAWLFATTTRFVNPLLVGEHSTISGRIVARHALDPIEFVVRLIVRSTGNRVVCLSDGLVRIDVKD